MKKTTTAFKIISFLLFMVNFSEGNIINVPSTYPYIQAAINASSNGDTILVAPGTYFENINFRGKKIVLTSMYYLNSDTSFVYNTIINGSQPLNPDTASCVIFNNGEDSTTVLQGFTITGGQGTKWTDEQGAGIYREGGGILVAFTSPVIQHNLIVNNYANNMAGVSGAGGGGIRAGNGNPKILNNTFCYNRAKYGEAIVLNFGGGIIKNNLICYNSGGSTYGAAAVWSNGDATMPRIIENNTITKNSSTNSTAGFCASQTTGYQALINNIIYDNHSNSSLAQILKYGTSTTDVTYCNIQYGYAGNGNINVTSLFADTIYFHLAPGSPCIDAGDSSVIYNDQSTGGSTALFPSMGLVRNDIGAYGGQGAGWLPSAIPVLISINQMDDAIKFAVSPNPFNSSAKISFNSKQRQHFQISVNDVNGKEVVNVVNENLDAGAHTFTLERNMLKPGVYLVNINSAGKVFTEKIVVE